MNYVETRWLFYSRQLRGEQVKALKSRVSGIASPRLQSISEYHGDPSLAQFI